MTASNDPRHATQGRAALPPPPREAALLDPTLLQTNSRAHLLPPLAGIIELVVLTGLIVAVGLMLPGVDLADIQPNPFWLPVLLLTLQYGTVSGILAAATALLVMLLAGLPEPGVGENYFNYAMRVFAQPILWFGAAVLLGQFRMRQIQAKRGLTAMVLDLEAQRASLAGYARSLRRRCDMLERDRAGSAEASGVTLLASLAEASAANPTDPAPAFSRLMAAAFPGARASLLAVRPSGLVAVASTDGGLATQPLTDTSHPAYRAVVVEGRGLSVLKPGDEHTLSGLGLAAAPVRDGSGTVIGAVILKAADPAALSAATLPALGVIGAALGMTGPNAASGATGLTPTDAAGSTASAVRGTSAIPATADGKGEAGTGSIRSRLVSVPWMTRRTKDDASGDADEPGDQPAPRDATVRHGGASG